MRSDPDAPGTGSAPEDEATEATEAEQEDAPAEEPAEDQPQGDGARHPG